MDWDILPRRAAWWPRCGSPMLCSDGPPLLDGCRWLSLVRFPVVACVEPRVRLSFSLRKPQHKIVPPLAPGYSSCCNLFP
ncbi:hypothetical protein ACQJBY_022115 [Aegilops geniculata]